MARDDRQQVWIDSFQTRLTLRIAGYLVLFMGVLINVLFAWKLISEGLTDPAAQFVEMLRTYLPVLICLVLLVPVMAWDAIRFTHRLVGPMVRFRRTIRSIADGEAVAPIKLREGDHLLDLRDEFNGMLESLQRRGVPVLKPAVPAEDEARVRPA